MTINGQQKKILVIRAGNLGDVLMATPVVRKLKNIFPGCRIDFVTAFQAKIVVETNKHIDNIFIYRKYKGILGSIKKFIFERSLAHNGYDFCLVLEQHPQYHCFARNIMGNHGLKIGLTSVPETNYLDHALSYHPDQEHVIQTALFLLRDFLNATIKTDDYLMDFTVPDKTEQKMKDLLSEWKLKSWKYFVIHPGCSEYLPLRAWVRANYIQVIRFLRTMGYKVFLTGAKSDLPAIEEIIEDGGFSEVEVEGFVDRHLYDVSFLIKHAAGVLSLDTGIMHLARALRVPVVALFGPSNPLHTGCIGPGPYVQIRNDFKCGPCNYFPQYRFEDKKNCLHGRPPACMESISVQQVTDALGGILGHG